MSTRHPMHGNAEVRTA